MNPGNDDFADRLAALDEGLAEGITPIDARELSKDSRLASARQVLQLLEGVWPRKKSVESVNLPSGFARFRLLRILGTGGFGIVYLAEDSRLGRQVALKMPRPEMMLTPTLRERFVREARAVAQLHHPNIVPIHDSGEIGAYCFLVTTYCSGGSLSDWLMAQQTQLPFKTAAQLIAVLADAVHHAHQRGILHRDLKPANILLTPVTEVSEALLGFPFSPHVTDFGLAKAIQETGDARNAETLTRSGAFLGTPAYVAPEQANSKNESVTIAVDVYALGAILYELLTGQPPFRADTHLDMLRQVVDAEPVPPRRHRREIPRDLEAICLKCLEKLPERRYADASALAADLRRFLNDKPTTARPLNVFQRAAKAVRRRRVASALWAAFVVVLSAATGGIAWHLAELKAFQEAREAGEKREEDLKKNAKEAAELAKKQDRQIRLQTYVAKVSAAERHIGEKRFEVARELLVDQKPKAKEEDLRDFAWRYLWHHGRGEWPIKRSRKKETIVALSYSPDGETLVSANTWNWLETHDPFTGKSWSAHKLPMFFPWPNQFKFSPGNKRVAVQCWRDKEKQHDFAVFNLESQRFEFHTSQSYSAFIGDCAFSPDGESIVFSDVREYSAVFLLEISTQKVSRLMELKGHEVVSLAFSPDGGSVAATFETRKKTVYAVHHFKSGTNQFAETGAPGRRNPDRLYWSRDGTFLVCASHTLDNALFDTQPLKFRRYLPLPDGKHGYAKSISPDGKYVAIAESKLVPDRGRLHILRTADGSALPHVFEIETSIQAAEWSPTENVLAIAGHGEDIQLWNPFAPRASRTLSGHQPKEAWGVAFSPNGKSLASVGDDHQLRLWDPLAGDSPIQHEGHTSLASCVAYAPNGKWIATGSYDDSVRLCDAVNPSVEIHRFQHVHDLRSVAFSHDSLLLASAGRDKVVRLWNPATGKGVGILEGHSNTVNSLAFHPRRNILASASMDGSVRIWDVDKKTLLHTLPHNKQVWSLAFSPNGTTLVSGSEDGAIAFWNVADATLQATVYRHVAGVRSLAFSPDGNTLVSGSQDKTVRLFNPEIHQELFAFPIQTHEVNSVAFSPDGAFLAAALHDGTIAVWHGPK